MKTPPGIWKKYRFLSVSLLVICFLGSPLGQLYAQKTILKTYSIGKVPLPYTFRTITSKCITKAEAWKWRDDNQGSKKWRPQGICGVCVDSDGKVDRDGSLSCFEKVRSSTASSTGDTPYLLVSWYDSDAEKKGAKISVVNLDNNTYRNVLLVNQNYKDYESMHAGGITAINGKLHVGDSRNDTIRVFDLDEILYLNEDINTHYYYVLMEEFNYPVPLKPSTLSYDASQDLILIGKYKPSSKSGVPFCWISPPKTATEAETSETDYGAKIFRIPDKYKKLQGIASKVIADIDGGKKIELYVAQSYGDYDGTPFKPSGYKQSTVSKLVITIDQNTEYDKIIRNKLTYGTPIQPDTSASIKFKQKCGDGVESIFLTDYGLWTLTEFADTRKVLLFKKPDTVWPTE